MLFIDISGDRSVKDIQASSYFIDYSPMALILNNEDYDSERMRTYASFSANNISFR